MITPVAVAELPEVHMLIERVIVTSVAASTEEKAMFLANVRSNLDQWAKDPEKALHLKFSTASALSGVVMVKSYWNLCHLFVAPERQGRGIGRLLIEAAIEECRRVGARPELRVNAARNAIPFYERMGFLRIPEVSSRYIGTPLHYKL
jgi:GNAT superfamily N-acetyltransferase